MVTGDPETDRNAGTEADTLVTVPPLVLLLLGGVAHVPSPRQNVELLADVPELRLATGKFPDRSPTGTEDEAV